MEYQAVFKCRLCGEVYNAADRKTSSKSDALGLLDSVVTANTSHGYFGAFMKDEYVHKCADGSIGIAELLGFKVEE